MSQTAPNTVFCFILFWIAVSYLPESILNFVKITHLNFNLNFFWNQACMSICRREKVTEFKSS